MLRSTDIIFDFLEGWMEYLTKERQRGELMASCHETSSYRKRREQPPISDHIGASKFLKAMMTYRKILFERDVIKRNRRHFVNHVHKQASNL